MIAYEKKPNKTRRALILSLLVVLGFTIFLVSEKLMNDGEETLVFNEIPVLKLPDDESIRLPYTVDAIIAIDYFDGEAGDIPKVVEFEGVYRQSQGIDLILSLIHI